MAIPVHVMIRPRGGDFTYTRDEIDAMRHDITVAKSLGAAGVVFGVLTKESDPDAAIMKELIEIARPMSVTFHRAFDLASDPIAALELAIELGVDRILTSGQRPTAVEGIDLLRSLVEHAEGRIIVMPGAGINAGNACAVIEGTGAREVHVASAVTDLVYFRHAWYKLAPRREVNPGKVREMIAAMRDG
jgi:copper homeostasis protein